MIRKKITKRDWISSFRHKSGFTLVELSVVLVVISLLVAGGLAASVSMVNRSAYIDTRAQLQQIERSLRDYYTVYGRLPCVASLTEATTSSTFGLETGATGTTCYGGVAESTPGHRRVDGTGGAKVRVGMIPVRTLGLPDSAAADKFGNRIVYAVTERLTDAGQFGNAPGAITVEDMGNNNILTDAAYFIASLGRDRKGAYTLNNASLVEACGSSGNLDVRNCTLTDAIFREAPFNSGTEENYFFDDLVRWAPKFHLTSMTTQSSTLWSATGDDIFSVGVDDNTETTNVGIGASAPAGKLEIRHDDGNSLLLSGTNAGDRYIRLLEDKLTESNFYKGAFLRYDNTNNNFILGTHEALDSSLASDINALTIKRSNGNIGIGTTTPQGLLDISQNGGNNILLTGTSGGDRYIRFLEDTVNGTYQYRGTYLHYDSSSNQFVLGTHEAMDTLTSSDRAAITIDRYYNDVYIGDQFNFYQTGANSYMYMGYAGATNANIYGGVTSSARLDLAASDSGVEGASIDLNGRATGNVGRIGYIASTGVTNGTSAHYFGTRNAAGSIVFLAEIRSNGSMILQGSAGTCNLNNGTGATNCTSDARLKKDVTPIMDSLEKLKNIKGIYYRWNDKADTAERILDKETRRIGVLAQDVQKVFPEAVQEGDDGYLMVSLDALIPALIESVKELDARNQSLRSKVDDLETRLAALEQRGTGAIATPSFDLRSSFIFLLIFGTAMLLYIRLKHKP